MIFCLGAKLVLSLLGLWTCWYFPMLSPYIQALLIGILPIWGEVLASAVTKYEPAREKSLRLLIVDAAIDATVFVLIPSGWFYLQFSQQLTFAVLVSLLVFVGCGILRLGNFVRQGLSSEGKFHGLPVTYTGYQWIVFVGLMEWNLLPAVTALLIVVSVLMISKRRFIKASR